MLVEESRESKSRIVMGVLLLKDVLGAFDVMGEDWDFCL